MDKFKKILQIVICEIIGVILILGVIWIIIIIKHNKVLRIIWIIGIAVAILFLIFLQGIEKDEDGEGK